jgi:hypothetical protein
LKTQLVRLLGWRDAHADFDAAVAGLPPALRGVQPLGMPYSAWQLLEHLRLTQADILAYCRRADYEEPDWPAAYWPAGAAPPDDAAWEASVAAFRSDRKALVKLIEDPGTDLFGHVPSATKHTVLRGVLVVVDHNAYHIGQLVAVRRFLGAWGP